MPKRRQIASQCEAANCDSNDGTSLSTLNFFSFPSDSDRKRQWAKVCEREDAWLPNAKQKLCQEHFTDDQFENRRMYGSKKLKLNSVPTITSTMLKQSNSIVKLEDPTYGIKTEPLYQGYEERLMESDELDLQSTCQICDHPVDNYPKKLCTVCQKSIDLDREQTIQKKKKQMAVKYKCNECSKTFSNVNTYHRHIKCHDEKKPYRCHQCQLRFYHSKTLAEHMQIHESSFSAPAVPTKKPQSSSDPTLANSELTDESVKIKLEEDNDFQPNDPKIRPENLNYSNESDIKFEDDNLAMVKIESFESLGQVEGNETVDMGNDIFFENTVTPGFNDTENYESIIKIEPETILPTVTADTPETSEAKEETAEETTRDCYICKHCNKDFMYFGNYAKHLQQHSAGKLVCKFCHQMFSTTYQLRKHIRDYHSNQEMFDCSVCFTTLPKHYFAAHMRTHRSDDKTLICKYCGCRFSEPSALFYHFKNQHSDSAVVITQLNDKIDDATAHGKYKCKYCGTTYDDVIKLYHHVKVHIKFR